MQTAPSHFEESLRLFDPLLGVRWSDLKKEWVIERKAFVSEKEIGFLRRRRDRAFRSSSLKTGMAKIKTFDLACQIAEELNSAVQGKRVIIFAKDLDRRIFDALVMGDIRRYGGYSRFADMLDAEEDKRERDLIRQMSNENDARSKEAFDQMNFLWRRRETQLLDGKRDMQELLK